MGTGMKDQANNPLLSLRCKITNVWFALCEQVFIPAILFLLKNIASTFDARQAGTFLLEAPTEIFTHGKFSSSPPAGVEAYSFSTAFR